LILFVLIAAGAGILGGVVAVAWAPGVTARGSVQHFAAGVVIAAVALELIPEAQTMGTTLGILGGFIAGGVAMIGLKWAVLEFERRERARRKLPVGLAAAAAVDTLIDGAIIGAGFSAGPRLGGLLAFALGLELFFLTLSVGTEFHRRRSWRWHGLAVTTGISVLLMIGAGGAAVFLAGASKAVIAVWLAFGAAALIYLVAEELLVESIQAEENLFTTAMLFAGFTVLLALTLVSRPTPP
jgi:ZIP family zinc transporter